MLRCENSNHKRNSLPEIRLFVTTIILALKGIFHTSATLYSLFYLSYWQGKHIMVFRNVTFNVKNQIAMDGSKIYYLYVTPGEKIYFGTKLLVVGIRYEENREEMPVVCFRVQSQKLLGRTEKTHKIVCD
jgi:hypothetical protein